MPHTVKAEDTRAAFERLILESADNAGFSSNPNLERSTENPERYADAYVQSAWYGFSEGLSHVYVPVEKPIEKARPLSVAQAQAMRERIKAMREDANAFIDHGLRSIEDKK